MKAFDIAAKDMLRSFRSISGIAFMFLIPLMVTGMFYLMFGRIASGEFDMPRTSVVIANLDEGGPKFQVDTDNVPGGETADTMGELLVGILRSDEVGDLVEVTLAKSAEAARQAVDSQTAQVALIIPPDFSEQYADPDGKAQIEFYQDPTLTIGPAIVRSMLNRFTDGMASVKILVDVFIDEADPADYGMAASVVQQYLDSSLVQSEDLEGELLEVKPPSTDAQSDERATANPILAVITPILGGMMTFYAFYTGTSTAQSILREEEERTLPRLFTTPTPQSTILTGKFLAVFLMVGVQVTTLLIAGKLIFGIRWGSLPVLAMTAAGLTVSAASFGVFVCSFMKSQKQGGAVFGGVLTLSGMLGMIPVFALNSPSAAAMADSVSLLVPQGWAVRGILQAMNEAPLVDGILTAGILFAWAAAFFAVGVSRFNRRYA